MCLNGEGMEQFTDYSFVALWPMALLRKIVETHADTPLTRLGFHQAAGVF